MAALSSPGALVQVPPGFECGPESTFARLILETGAQVCAVCASCGSLAGIDADACTTRRAQACVQNLRAHIKLLQDFSKEAKRELGEYFRQYDALVDKHFPADGTAMQQEYRKALAVRDLYGNGARRKAVFGKFDFEAYREELLEFLSVMDQHIGESYIVKVRLYDVCSFAVRALTRPARCGQMFRERLTDNPFRFSSDNGSGARAQALADA